MTTLREAATAALEALELAQTDVHWELNSPTRKFLRKAEKSLRAALAEPVQEPYWYATPDGKYLSSNEVREWMDPKTKALHLEPPQWRKEELIPLYATPPQRPTEPVAWRFEARHIDSAFGPAVSIRHPGREHKYMRNVMPLYTAPPPRKPLTEEEIQQCFKEAGITIVGEAWTKAIRAIERAHGIT